jgi:hypothetical protein
VPSFSHGEVGSRAVYGAPHRAFVLNVGGRVTQPLSVALDLDDTTGDYIEGFRRYVMRELGVPREALPDVTTPDIWHSWSVLTTPDTFFDLHAKAVSEGRLLRDMPAIEGAFEAVAAWMNSGRVNVKVLSHRFVADDAEETVAADTVAWFKAGLEAHGVKWTEGGRPRIAVHLTGDKLDVLSDLFVDDQPRYVRAYVDAGRNAVLFDRPRNRAVEHDDLPRVTDWRVLRSLAFDLASLKENGQAYDLAVLRERLPVVSATVADIRRLEATGGVDLGGRDLALPEPSL